MAPTAPGSGPHLRVALKARVPLTLPSRVSCCLPWTRHTSASLDPTLLLHTPSRARLLPSLRMGLAARPALLSCPPVNCPHALSGKKPKAPSLSLGCKHTRCGPGAVLLSPLSIYTVSLGDKTNLAWGQEVGGKEGGAASGSLPQPSPPCLTSRLLSRPPLPSRAPGLRQRTGHNGLEGLKGLSQPETAFLGLW